MVGLFKLMNKRSILVNILCIFFLITIIYAKESYVMTSKNKKMDIPIAIQNFVDATNEGDSKKFVNTFTNDSYIRDWFSTYKGYEGVSSWNRSDNIGKNTSFDILAIKDTEVKNEYILKVKVSGDGYNGVSDISFTIRDSLIWKMIISPW